METKYVVITLTSIVMAAAAVYLFRVIECRVNGSTSIGVRIKMSLLPVALSVILLPNIYLVMKSTGMKSLLLLNILLFTAVLSSYEDLKYKLIEDEIHLFAFITGILVYSFTGMDIKNRLLGFALGGGILLIIAILSKGGMGGADIKLMAVYGMLMGPQKTFIALLLGFTAGAVISLFLMALKLVGRKDTIPFSPFLSLGSILAFLFGDVLISIYFRLVFN